MPTEVEALAAAGEAGVIRCVDANGAALAPGTPLDVSLRYKDAAGTQSASSVSVTMICADVPSSPAAPTLLLGSLDIILLEWEPPASTGGSPILGYEVLMSSDAVPTAVQVYDGKQNPATRTLAIRTF